MKRWVLILALVSGGMPMACAAGESPMAFGIFMRTADDVAVPAGALRLSLQDLLLLAGVLVVVLFAMVVRGWSRERRVRREMAVAATMERWRSRILEDINRAQPLNEIIRSIVDLVSYKLKGTPCWCRLTEGEMLGNAPSNLETSQLVILQHEIPSHSGGALGCMFAGFHSGSSLRSAAPDALFGAAQLAALAIETRGLYLDLVHRSEFDLLTDTHNRFSLEKLLDRLIDGERREDGSFGLIYIDLDDFKLVNDQHGHRTGDLFLQEAARRMSAQLRPADVLARMGGDEFAVLVPMAHSRSDLAEIAARLEECFRDPFELEQTTICGTASIGTAFYPQDGADPRSLLGTADAAMYVAKNTRRNRVPASAD